jgi:hypothetical protein
MTIVSGERIGASLLAIIRFVVVVFVFIAELALNEESRNE